MHGLLSVERGSMFTPRILVVDDEMPLLESYRDVLSVATANDRREELDALETELFGGSQVSDRNVRFDIHLCQQGEEAIAEVRAASGSGNPFAVVIVDVRMPPGIDGVRTAEQIRQIDPDIYIVIATGFSDVDPAQIAERVLPADKFLFCRKPMKAPELLNVAIALSEKWRVDKGGSGANWIS